MSVTDAGPNQSKPVGARSEGFASEVGPAHRVTGTRCRTIPLVYVIFGRGEFGDPGRANLPGIPRWFLTVVGESCRGPGIPGPPVCTKLQWRRAKSPTFALCGWVLEVQ